MQMKQGKVNHGHFWREATFELEGSELSTSLFKRRIWQNRIKDLPTTATGLSALPAFSTLPRKPAPQKHQVSHLLISLRSKIVFIKVKISVCFYTLVFFDNIILPFSPTSKNNLQNMCSPPARAIVSARTCLISIPKSTETLCIDVL